MKYLFKLILLILTISQLSAQNEFGAVGSHWNYFHSSHSGDGYGWDMILVEGDTIIMGKEHKILSRTYSRTQLYPESSTINSYYIVGTMLIENDSVFVNDKLILDFSMEIGDTLELNLDNGIINLVTDSITIENINGINHKKWYLQKLCIDGPSVGSNGYVEVLEGIGQVGAEYLFWNLDGCTVIGGGSNSLTCYNNGDFEYPEMTGCEILVNSKEINDEQIEIYPNPANEFLIITNSSYNIGKLKIYNSTGKMILEKSSIHSNSININISRFDSGFYFIELEGSKNTINKKFIKI